MENNYKYEEIKEYFDNFIKEQGEVWVNNNIDDLHYHCFYTYNYVDGTDTARRWLGDAWRGNGVKYVIAEIKKHDGSDMWSASPEEIVNRYVMIIGEEIVDNYTLTEI